jgi:hypothetical protein
MERTPSEGVAAKHIAAMKLSTEAIVAAAVAVAFAVLSLGAIAREQSDRGTNGPNAYVATSNPGLSHITARGSSSLSGSGENEALGLY